MLIPTTIIIWTLATASSPATACRSGISEEHHLKLVERINKEQKHREQHKQIIDSHDERLKKIEQHLGFHLEHNAMTYDVISKALKNLGTIDAADPETAKLLAKLQHDKIMQAAVETKAQRPGGRPTWPPLAEASTPTSAVRSPYTLLGLTLLITQADTEVVFTTIGKIATAVTYVHTYVPVPLNSILEHANTLAAHFSRAVLTLAPHYQDGATPHYMTKIVHGQLLDILLQKSKSLHDVKQRIENTIHSLPKTIQQHQTTTNDKQVVTQSINNITAVNHLTQLNYKKHS